MLLVEPPTYGREFSGTASTIASHATEVTNDVAAKTAPRFTRSRHDVDASSTPMATAGNGMHAANILVLNARPMRMPATVSQRIQRGLSNERITAHAAPRRNRSIHGSGRLRRLTATLIGDTANTKPAIVAATTPNRRRTMHHKTATAAVPAKADGRIRLHVETPNSRTDTAVIHSGTGGLSTLMNPPGSNAAKNQLCQLSDIDRAAAFGRDERESIGGKRAAEELYGAAAGGLRGDEFKTARAEIAKRCGDGAVWPTDRPNRIEVNHAGIECVHRLRGQL